MHFMFVFQCALFEAVASFMNGWGWVPLYDDANGEWHTHTHTHWIFKQKKLTQEYARKQYNHFASPPTHTHSFVANRIWLSVRDKRAKMTRRGEADARALWAQEWERMNEWMRDDDDGKQKKGST